MATPNTSQLADDSEKCGIPLLWRRCPLFLWPDNPNPIIVFTDVSMTSWYSGRRSNCPSLPQIFVFDGGHMVA